MLLYREIKMQVHTHTHKLIISWREQKRTHFWQISGCQTLCSKGRDQSRQKHHLMPWELRLYRSQGASIFERDSYSPVFDERLEVEGEAHAERQQRRVFLQHFGQNLKVCLAVLVRKLSRGQLHLEDATKHEHSPSATTAVSLKNIKYSHYSYVQLGVAVFFFSSNFTKQF